MFLSRVLPLTAAIAGLVAACATGGETKPTERQFYKNPYVRRCLQYDKEQLALESQACWARLLKRVQGEPGFKEKAKFTDSDVAKMRKMSGLSIQRSEALENERNQCLNIPASKRDERIGCFQAFLDKHKDQMTRSQRYEVENAITAMKEAGIRAAGEVEATMEHAAKLLGARLLEEREGVRVDALSDGPMKQAQVREQGMIVAVDGALMAEVKSEERIARLEACEDGPVVLLVRHGGMGDITFTRAEVSCGEKAQGKREWEVVLPKESCTQKDSPEIRLGISWCYLSRDGVLEVEEVCAGTPAAAAGVRPGHKYVSINGESLLGKTYLQVAELLKTFPQDPLQLQEKGGALQSPSPVGGSPLSDEQAAKCWSAIKTVLDEGSAPGRP